MTGFGVGEATLGACRIAVETRSVNHRFLDVRARMPRELSEYGTYLEQLARARLSRGRVELNVRFDGVTVGAVAVDKRRAADAYRALVELRDELQLTEPVPMSLLGSVPDLFVSPVLADPDGVRSALATALDQALDGLESMRRSEGDHLGKDVAARLKVVCELSNEVGRSAPELPDRYRRRLRERIARLLDGQDLVADPARLELEVAVFADHADVSEELTRLSSHCQQFETLLSAEEPVGRRMDFLLQEMAREVNTIGSKANEADISIRVVELKAQLEKMREQIQNVE